MEKLTIWLSTVAMAAPAVSSPKTKMKRGSSRIFSTPPAVMPTMAYMALP